METIKQIIQDIKVRSSLQGQANIGSLANSFRLSEEDIRILTFASKPIREDMKHEELQFADEIYKYNIGDTVTLTLVRKRRFLKVDVPLKVFPVNADKMYSKIQTPSLPKPVQPKKKP